MSFEDIPEDSYRAYPCPCGGDIVKEDGYWECDMCGFKKKDLEE